MRPSRLYLHRLSNSTSLVLTRAKDESRLPVDGAGGEWKFWMQFTPTQIDQEMFGAPLDQIQARITETGYFRFTGTDAFVARHLGPPPRQTAMPYGEEPFTVYLFQCGTEDLFAVSRNRSPDGLPRSPCTQGWEMRDEFQLHANSEIPVPVIEDVILQGIARSGYYIWRGWTTALKRPK